MKTATAINFSAAVILALLQLLGLAALLSKSQVHDVQGHANQTVLTLHTEDVR